jgi:hypothetical protein
MFAICSFDGVVSALAVCVHELCAPGFETAHCCHVVTFLQHIFCCVRRTWLRILLLWVGRRVRSGEVRFRRVMVGVGREHWLGREETDDEVWMTSVYIAQLH